jgi:hypothetical protein
MTMSWILLSLACTGDEDLPPEGSADASECSDGFDNDKDGDVDCGDADCASVRDDCDELGRDTDEPHPDDSRDHTGWRHSDRWDSDEDCDEDVVWIDSIDMNCDQADWWFDVYSVGWMSSPDLYIYQTGSETPWDESHPFPAESYDFDPNGCWDNFYLQLARTDDPDAVVSGETTLYQCDNARKDSLTWHLVIYDVDGAESDCAVWGDDPDSLETGCADWN